VGAAVARGSGARSLQRVSLLEGGRHVHLVAGQAAHLVHVVEERRVLADARLAAAEQASDLEQAGLHAGVDEVLARLIVAVGAELLHHREALHQTRVRRSGLDELTGLDVPAHRAQVAGEVEHDLVEGKVPLFRGDRGVGKAAPPVLRLHLEHVSRVAGRAGVLEPVRDLSPDRHVGLAGHGVLELADDGCAEVGLPRRHHGADLDHLLAQRLQRGLGALGVVAQRGRGGGAGAHAQLEHRQRVGVTFLAALEVGIELGGGNGRVARGGGRRQGPGGEARGEKDADELPGEDPRHAWPPL
jgi:hypothetical protein